METIKQTEQTRHDGYVDLLSGYGTRRDSDERYRYRAEFAADSRTLAAQYESNALFAKVIDIPATECVKHGFAIETANTEAVEMVAEALDDLDFEEIAARAIKWSRLFGGAIAVLLCDDGGALTDPLNPAALRGVDEIRVYERSLLSFDTSKPFPDFYTVNSMYGSFAVHATRCLAFRNGVLPEHCTSGEYRVWGAPEYVRISRELRRAVTSHGYASLMLEKSVQPVYSVEGLSEELSFEGGEENAMKRLTLIDMARSMLNSIAIDKEDSYDFKTFSLSGVRDVIDASCNMLSAVTNIPQTILFGRSPAGENATGKGDLENYYNYVEGLQKTFLKRNLRRLVDLILRSAVNRGELDEIDRYKVIFNPLWSPTDKEKAEAEKLRADTAAVRANTANIYVQMGALDPSEVRKGLAESADFDVETILDDMDESELWAEWKDPAEQANSLTNGQKNGIIEGEENREDGGKGSGRFPKGSGKNPRAGQYSASGANPSLPGFTEANLNTHWSGSRTHSKQYKGMTKAQYAERAESLVRSPTSDTVFGYRGGDGCVVRYDSKTNDYVKGYDTGIATMYKPDRGYQYFEERLKIDEGET